MKIERVLAIDVPQMKKESSGFFLGTYDILSQLQQRFKQAAPVGYPQRENLINEYRNYVGLVRRMAIKWEKDSSLHPELAAGLAEIRKFRQLLEQTL